MSSGIRRTRRKRTGNDALTEVGDSFECPQGKIDGIGILARGARVRDSNDDRLHHNKIESSRDFSLQPRLTLLFDGLVILTCLPQRSDTSPRFP